MRALLLSLLALFVWVNQSIAQQAGPGGAMVVSASPIP